MISHHAALIYTMVLVAASDREMTDAEMRRMGEIIRNLPVFADYSAELLPNTASACAELLDETDGLDKTLELIESALPAKLRETAYALACDVAAADGRVREEEVRMLELIRHGLEIERLAAAAIERGARA
ncbi:MAG: tellurite resistance TerB family protein, partial [Rhodospirillales bacterium]|nr:tellurite resistance TerB family protein [Rhodospirillales bacterium]